MTARHKIFTIGTELIIPSPSDMQALGAKIGMFMQEGDILALMGELGAGKTHLVQGILQGMGCSTHATSPTFGIVHEHADGRIPLCHFDFYRLNSEQELLGLDWDDYLSRGGILVIEWADKFPSAIPPTAIWIQISHLDETTRQVCIK